MNNIVIGSMRRKVYKRYRMRGLEVIVLKKRLTKDFSKRRSPVELCICWYRGTPGNNSRV